MPAADGVPAIGFRHGDPRWEALQRPAAGLSWSVTDRSDASPSPAVHIATNWAWIPGGQPGKQGVQRSVLWPLELEHSELVPSVLSDLSPEFP